MSECANCGAVDEEDAGIIVHKREVGGDSQCNVCRADYLAQNTTLSQREAEVAALKQIAGASHARIAEMLGLERSTVGEYRRRIGQKVREADQTVQELSEFR